MPRGAGKSPLFKHIARGSIQIIGGLGLGLLVAVLLVAWRLTSGPVSVSFLTPYIDQALAEVHQGAFNVTFDDTILTWAGWERTLDIRIVNLRTTLPSGELVASIPEVSISLSANALLHGTVGPRSVEFFGPNINVVRQADGQFAMGFAGASQGSQDFAASLIFLMLQKPDPSRAMSYLKRISVVAGEVTFEDNALGTTWHAPSADAAFTRTESGLRAELDLDLQAGDKLAAVSVLGDYSPENKRIELGVNFDGVTPAVFAGLSDKAVVLGALDLPVSGTVTLSMEQNGRIENVGFDLVGTSGYLAMPVLLAARLDALPWAQRVGVSGFEINGSYDGHQEVLDITKLIINAQPGEMVYVPAPVDHVMPVAMINAALRYEEAIGLLNVSKLNVDVGGPRVEISASLANLKIAEDAPIPQSLEPSLEGFEYSVSPDLAQDVTQGLEYSAPQSFSTDGIAIDFSATAYDVPFDRLGELWPKDLGVDARTWVLESLSKGIADRATVSAALRANRDGGVELVSLAGDMQGHGIDVQYLATMPKVSNAKGSATFNENRFDIHVESGESEGGLKITGGDVALVDLQTDLQWAEIKLDVEGPVPAALRVIDSEPLRFASDLGIEPDTAEGNVAANISLRIPLLYTLETAQIEAIASARLSGTGLKGALFERDMSAGELTLNVTHEGLDLQGEAHLGGIPVKLAWKHDFRENALFLDRYELSGTIEDVLNLDDLGVQVPEILARYMQGGVAANVSTTTFSDGRHALSARVDLTDIQLAIPELGWSKPTGVPAAGVMEVRLDKEQVQEIPNFSVTAPDMNISGSAKFSPQGELERIDLDTMRSGLTNVAGSLTPVQNNYWELVLRGESLDARYLWDEFIGIQDTPPTDAEAQSDNTDENFIAFDIAVDLRSVIMHKERVISDLIGSLYRRDDLWVKMDVVGTVADGAPLSLMLDSDQQGLRYLSIASSNAGAALLSLDLYDNMLGGILDLKAAYTQRGKDAPLEGVVKITDFAMIRAPLFTKLIGVMSLTGVLDALQGDGLNFDILEAPFKLQNGVAQLIQARASGPSIGVTTYGQVGLGNRMLDLKGTVVPAYAINALLGKIPLIGELFSGSEKGGGLFAATYTMIGQGEDADITVNPLSVLAPGVLRDIFTGSDKENEIPAIDPNEQPVLVEPSPVRPAPVKPAPDKPALKTRPAPARPSPAQAAPIEPVQEQAIPDQTAPAQQ